jgi:arginine decarboxylase
LTQSTFFAENTGSKTTESQRGQTLRAAINRHLRDEKVSFHTPGHKGRFSLGMNLAQADLTELPGLDQLSYPEGVLQTLECRISALWNSTDSVISVNGASAALSAAIIASASFGKKLVLPRNAHRAALSGLVLSGLEALWYEPEWLPEWNTWGCTSLESVREALAESNGSTAAVLLCSPNYAGILSDVKAIAELCHAHDAILIVDEAHGAHLFGGNDCPAGAVKNGADIVIHSLHKTLSAPTQTGVLHLANSGKIEKSALRAALKLLQSSSPSYLLMLGIEQMLEELELNGPDKVYSLAKLLRSKLAKTPEIQLLSEGAQDPLHILIKHKKIDAQNLYTLLANQGIFAETILGDGLLLLLGQGSSTEDVELLLRVLETLESQAIQEQAPGQRVPGFVQKMNSRSAFFSRSECVEATSSISRISADWIAPCPPGHAIVAPGQEIGPEILHFLNHNTSIRVVKDQLEGDSDGPNTTS